MEPSTSLAVVPAKAGTHNHRLWNMGPRFRGDDSMYEQLMNRIRYEILSRSREAR
jgi:hypothetical protein